MSVITYYYAFHVEMHPSGGLIGPMCCPGKGKARGALICLYPKMVIISTGRICCKIVNGNFTNNSEIFSQT